MPRLGVGVDGVNLRCTAGWDPVGVYLPTGTDVLEEVLLGAGVRPLPDEKRACYLPVVRLFGGLDEAARAFSGQRGAVLRALAAGPQSVGELAGRARLGGGKLKELAHPEWPPQFLATLDPVARRALLRLSRDRWSRTLPATTEAEALLEFWADRGVVTRQWQVGPCPACMGTYWEPRLDISRPVRCPGCDTRVRLPQRVPLGYSLHRLVAHAIRQGVAPVALTGRFLRRPGPVPRRVSPLPVVSPADRDRRPGRPPGAVPGHRDAVLGRRPGRRRVAVGRRGRRLRLARRPGPHPPPGGRRQPVGLPIRGLLPGQTRAIHGGAGGSGGRRPCPSSGGHSVGG